MSYLVHDQYAKGMDVLDNPTVTDWLVPKLIVYNFSRLEESE